MEQLIWLIIIVCLFAGVVWGGFWVIAKAGLPKAANWVFGVIVLIALVFALVALVQGRMPRWLN